MSRQDELNSYIARLQRRLQVGAWLRGLAILFGTALLVTVALVLLLNHYAFPVAGVRGARLALLLALATAAVASLAFPLLHLTRSYAVRKAETAHAELEQRLTTFHERQRQGNDPFLELLAADTLSRTQYAEPSSLAPDNLLFVLAGAGLSCLGFLLWLGIAGPGFLGYGTSLLWAGAKKDSAPLYAISVTPGDVAVRRNSDQLISARVTGMHPEKVQIFAHYQSGSTWEPVLMRPQPDSSKAAIYQFVFAGLPENVEYYVAAGPLISPHYRVRVVDLPSIKAIRVTYKYPKWTGMKPVLEEHTGDLRAIEGTDAAIEIETDRPLKDGQLALDDGKSIRLSGGEGNRYGGVVHMEKDGAYHLVAVDSGQAVRLSEDYFIATDKANPPEVAVVHPGGDYRASPIEEVKVGVEASDPFGLRDVRLHYSVNGAAARDINMLKAAGAKSADGSYTLSLEDFKLVPGDLVSLYATAKDGHSEARTEIGFIQIDPFEREFSQSQQSGGGGGGGGGGQNNQMEISRREKELIAATWKQQNDKSSNTKDAAATGQFLSDAQQKLRDQVMALSKRMESRDLGEANDEFSGFEKDMHAAAEAMAPSADKLKATQWKDALPLEQKALQALLHAEATFRQIQVAFGQQQGGGGGGAGSAGRDLASLFDLELDTEKNQYETAQRASPAEQHEKDVEDALAKLDALAKRQQELANQQHNPQQSFQERWQQEMLRREAEQLQQQMEQLAKNNQGQQQSSSNSQQASNSSSASSSSQQSSSSKSGARSSQQQASSSSSSGQNSDQQRPDQQHPDPRIEQALSRLRQAGEAMKRNSGTPQSADAARQAAERLQDATRLLGEKQQQMADGKLGSLSREADRLTQEERTQADQINKLAGQQSAPGAMDRDSMMSRLNERKRLADERQQLSDDLSKLQRNLRDTARQTAGSQPDLSKKLRDTLTELDQTDLDNHVQRTADWLRGGINPNSNGTENQIAQGLQKLSQQLRQAQQSAGEGKPRQQSGTQGEQTAMLNQVERLRSQLQAMSAASQRSKQQAGQRGSNGQQPTDNGQAQSGQKSGQQVANDPLRQGGQRSAQSGAQGDRFGQQGDQASASGGDIRNSGGGAGGAVWDNINTGNNRYSPTGPKSDPMDSSNRPADVERSYEQGMRQLNQLRQMVQGDAEAQKEVQELAQKMRQLDPKRFPGNPEIVEQMHREMLGSLDRIELQLQQGGASEARTVRPSSVPEGYREFVADYYKRLSRHP